MVRGGTGSENPGTYTRYARTGARGEIRPEMTLILLWVGSLLTGTTNSIRELAPNVCAKSAMCPDHHLTGCRRPSTVRDSPKISPRNMVTRRARLSVPPNVPRSVIASWLFHMTAWVALLSLTLDSPTVCPKIGSLQLIAAL